MHFMWFCRETEKRLRFISVASWRIKNKHFILLIDFPLDYYSFAKEVNENV